MIICFNCSKTKPLIAQPQNVVIGTLTESTDYKVYFGNIATGRVTMIEATTDAAGLLTVDLEFIPIMPDHDYSVWATLATADYKDNAPITIDGDVVTCLNVRFDVVRDSAGVKISVVNQTLELDA